MSDRPRPPCPVRLAQLAFVELPARIARQLTQKIDRARQLVAGDASLQELQQLGHQGIVWGYARGGLDDSFDFFAPFVVRHAEYRYIPDLGMVDELVLDLGRVDVDAAGDDHVDFAIAQVQIAVLVEVADVADRRVFAALGPRGLVRVLVVLQAAASDAVHRADLADWQHVAVLVHDHNLVVAARLADRTRFTQPLVRENNCAANALGRVVVLVQNRAPPLDHASLDFGRTWRCTVDHVAQRGD